MPVEVIGDPRKINVKDLVILNVERPAYEKIIPMLDRIERFAKDLRQVGNCSAYSIGNAILCLYGLRTKEEIPDISERIADIIRYEKDISPKSYLRMLFCEKVLYPEKSKARFPSQEVRDAVFIEDYSSVDLKYSRNYLEYDEIEEIIELACFFPEQLKKSEAGKHLKDILISTLNNKDRPVNPKIRISVAAALKIVTNDNQALGFVDIDEEIEKFSLLTTSTPLQVTCICAFSLRVLLAKKIKITDGGIFFNDEIQIEEKSTPERRKY